MKKYTFLLAAALLAIAMLMCIIGIASAEADNPPPSNLLFYLEVPEAEPYGHWPITVTVVVINQNPTADIFDLSVWVGGRAWGQQLGPVQPSPNTEVYWSEGGTPDAPNGVTNWWRGIIAPYGQARLIIPTTTGIYTGSYILFSRLTTITPAGVVITSGIELTTGPEKSAVIGFDKPWSPGEFRDLTLELHYSIATSFIIDSFESTCGIKGLPTKAISNPYRTWEKFLWFVYLPDNAPSGVCRLTAKIRTWGNNDKLEADEEFFIPFKLFIPLVNN